MAEQPQTTAADDRPPAADDRPPAADDRQPADVLKIGSWNVHGIKSLETEPDTKPYLSQFDIVALYETGTKQGDKTANFLPGYEAILLHGKRRSAEPGRTPGGIAVFVKTEIKEYVTKVESCEYALFIKLHKGFFGFKKNVLCAFAYIYPEGSTFYDGRDNNNGIEEFGAHLTRVKSQQGDCDVFLAGDFNARTGDLNEANNLPRKSRDTKKVNKFGKSFIELCRTNRVRILNGRFKGDPMGEYTFLNTTGGCSIVDYMAASYGIFQRVSDFFVGEVGTSDHFPVVIELEDHNISELAENLVGIIETAKVNIECKSKRICNSYVSVWDDRECQERGDEKGEALRKHRQSCSKQTLEDYGKAKKLYAELCDEKKRNYYFSPLLNVTHALSAESIKHVSNIKRAHDSIVSIFSKKITPEEVNDVINMLVGKKSPGPVGIMYEMYKNVLDILAEPLCTLFNSILSTSQYPEQWESESAGLSFAMRKIFTTIPSERLVCLADEMCEAQGANSQGQDTLYAMAEKNLDKKKGRFYVAFIDFSKVFGDSRWDELYQCVVPGTFLESIRSMYEQHTESDCMISPMLFLPYMSEFIDRCKTNGCQDIYLDKNCPNMLMCVGYDGKDTAAGELQKQLNALNEFCTTRKWDVNVSDINIVVFRTGVYKNDEKNWSYRGQKIDVVQYDEYFHTIFPSKLMWSKAGQTLCSHPNLVINSTRDVASDSVHISFKLFNTITVPRPLNVSTKWSLEYKADIKTDEHTLQSYIKLPKNKQAKS